MSAIRVRKGGAVAAQLRVLFPAIAKLLIGRWKWGLPQRYLCETVLENWNGHVHKIWFWIHVVKISQLWKPKAFEIPKFQNNILSFLSGFYSLEKKKNFTNSCPYKWNYKRSKFQGCQDYSENLSAQSYPFSSYSLRIKSKDLALTSGNLYDLAFIPAGHLSDYTFHFFPSVASF